jgi:hypothetical protein
MSKKSLIVIGFLGVLIIGATWLIPAYIRARNTPSSAPCVVNLMQIAGAKEAWALENRKSTNDTPGWDDIRPFLKPAISCQQGGAYILGRVGESPRCSVGGPLHSMPQ